MKKIMHAYAVFITEIKITLRSLVYFSASRKMIHNMCPSQDIYNVIHHLCYSSNIGNAGNSWRMCPLRINNIINSQQ